MDLSVRYLQFQIYCHKPHSPASILDSSISVPVWSRVCGLRPLVAPHWPHNVAAPAQWQYPVEKRRFVPPAQTVQAAATSRCSIYGLEAKVASLDSTNIPPGTLNRFTVCYQIFWKEISQIPLTYPQTLNIVYSNILMENSSMLYEVFNSHFSPVKYKCYFLTPLPMCML